MLNELFQLNACMESVGIPRNSWHKHYREYRPKKANFFLMIASDATVRDLEPPKNIEMTSSIRKYAVSNNFSFPAFNVYPLLWAKSDEAKDAVEKLKKTLHPRNRQDLSSDNLFSNFHRLWDVCEPMWTQGEKDRISQCLKTAGLKQRLSSALERIPDDYLSLLELMERSIRVKINELQNSLKSLILEKLRRFPQNADDWIDKLLVASSGKVSKVSIVLELSDRSSFPYPANHFKVIEWVNGALMRNVSGGPPNKKFFDVLDAFGWPLAREDSRSKFDSLILPVIGDTKLRAMNKESPCQARYGKIDSYSFPASSGVRQAMKDRLEWLCHESRKGKTWTNASGACGFSKRDGKKVPVSGLFLVYPSSLGEDLPKLAALFFGQDGALDPDGVMFESGAERVTSALKAAINEQPNVEVRVFVLVKADKARTKVLLSKQYDAYALISGAKEWQEGCQNIPPIRLNVGTNDKPKWIEPANPFPAEVVKCLNVMWFQKGQKFDQVYGLAIGEGVELFLSPKSSGQWIVQKALHLAIINSSPLLLALGHADHRRDSSLKLDSRFSRHARLLPCLLGLLLQKLDFVKGTYMDKAPFLVGRLLALADVLHKEYCRYVRKGDPLPQLIGNALMSTAVDDPVKGLARLQERLMIYQAWANRAQGEGFGLAKWALGQMGNVSTELARLRLPDRTNDADKAQMLLGYLARAGDKILETGNDPILDSEGDMSNGH